ncbi:peptidyl-tRNA hydrolase [Jiangella mangrovi]|uniref:peptidyl-tRNA hydrolase n=1 Tax=Jiangella mangrovi TaxID=1524084 RepID=A0A7W9LMT6_9ACTN|nr:peptidyl-tRNA hydrolase [Jiangella mangrovi]MBB5789613.1 peptidyl-tRNA hydrolase [Jiangella mangrovi]
MSEPGPEPDGGWAMQIVVHLPRPGSPEGDPPTRRALLEAVATAVGRLVDAAYADDADPRWSAAFRAYEGDRIRKVVRRARGIGWRRVQDLPGVGVVHDGASVRALLPVPVADTPDIVRKLQVGGTDIIDDGDGGGPGDHPADPAVAAALAVVVNPGVAMTAGKTAAQVGHAAQLAWHAMPAARRRAWSAAGCPVRLVPVAPRDWPATTRNRAAVVVRDGGLTEVVPGTTTAVAWW